MSDFENWFFGLAERSKGRKLTEDEKTWYRETSLDYRLNLEGWNARGVEGDKPQCPDTCKHVPPHSVLALVKRDKDWPQSNWPSVSDEACSTCAEIEAAVHAERQRWADQILLLRVMVNLAEERRCVLCGWPLADSEDKGCVVGNCSFRPGPGSFDYDRKQTKIAALRERLGEK